VNTVFFDVDTQLDFVCPSGALYVHGAEEIVPAVSRLNRYAATHAIPLVSTVDAHTEDDAEFLTWPHHCVAGSLGQRKAEATLIEGRVVLPNRPMRAEIAGARQIIIEKQTVKVFDAVTLAPVLQQLAAERFVLYGVVTEICVLWAARGLFAAGKRVDVVVGAIRELKPADGEAALDEVRAAGGRVIRLEEVVRE
jgi:nicotinamidase/pyrazinamidase